MPAVLNVDDALSSRASHILPTVKCSTCSHPVPLSQLTDHVCSSLPSSPTVPRTPRTPAPLSPTSPRRPYSPRVPQPGVPRVQSPIRETVVPLTHAHRPPALNLNLAAQAPYPMISTPPPRREDYMPGGASGMAGVGRRAFQAVAHAALFTQHQHQHHHHPISPDIRADTTNGANTEFLHTNYYPVGVSGRGTPPLSPNSTLSSSRSHSPLTPSLYHPPLTAALTPTSYTPITSTFRTNIPIPNSTTQPLPSPSSPHFTPSNSDMTSRLPFFQQRYKNATTPSTSPTNGTSLSKGRSTPRADPNPAPPSPSDSDSDAGGLAYDRDDDDEEDLLTTRLGSKTRDYNDDDRFAKLKKDRDFARDDQRERERERELERSREQDKDRFRVQDRERERAKNDREASRSTDRDRERERERERSARRDDLVGTSPPRRSNNVSPASHSNPSGSSAAASSTSRSASARTAQDNKDKKRTKKEPSRECLRCELKIQNARWVKTDDGRGVLCERCWKNMYLPKCRRCDKYIETAAVYSSDGQLKGKYHRECFTCAMCDKPFPDKTFYVFDGQPYCQFHYAEMNNSLCSRENCGKPIEGSCAIGYGGDKYHPDCLRCGQVGCQIRLVEEYWEVDGMMLCERHGSRFASESSGSDYGEEERVIEADWRRRETERERERESRDSSRRRKETSLLTGKARKRATRLINLDGGRGF